MDDLFADLAQGIHDRAKKRRNDGYVSNLPYPDLQAKPDFMSEFLGGLVRDPRQNMPMAGTNTSMQLEQGNETIDSFADSLVNTKDTLDDFYGVGGIADPNQVYIDPNTGDVKQIQQGDEGLGTLLIGNADKSVRAYNENRPSNLIDDLDLALIGLDAGTLGASSIARNAVKQTIKAPIEGVQSLSQIGTNFYDVLEAGAKVGGRVIKDKLDDFIPPSNGGLQPAYATPNPMNEFIKKIEDPIKPTRQEPLKADIPLDNTGLNPVTGVQVVAPRVATDFLDEVNNAVKEKERQLDRPLTEDEMADVRDNVTFDRYKDKDFRVADGLKEDEVLRLNSEGKLIKQIVDKTDTKDIFDLLPRKSNTRSNDGVILANDFKDRPIGDDPWKLVFEDGPVGTKIKLSDAVINGATEEQVGKSLLDRTEVNEVFPAIPRDIAKSKNPQEVADYFRETYRGHTGTGMASVYQSAKGRQNIQLNRNQEVVNAVADMRRLDIEDGGSRLKPTIQEIEDKINFNLRSGWLSLADGDKPITSIKQLKEEVSEKQFAGIMHSLTHHAKSDVLRNNLAKHLDNNPTLRNKPVPGEDLDPLSKQTNFEIDGVPVSKIIQDLDAQLNNKVNAIADKAGITTGDELMDNIKTRQLRSLFRKYGDLVNSGQIEEANKVINSPNLYPHLQNMQKYADEYAKESSTINQQIINAGQGLDPVTGDRPKKLSINKPTVMHEIEGHLTQEAHGMHHGGQSSQWASDIYDIQSLLENKMFLRDGNHGLQVRDLDIQSESQRRYMNMKGEVSARKSEANANKVTADNIHEPKSASDYKEPQTLDADGNWVNETFPSLQRKNANTNVSLEQSRINPSMDSYINTIIAQMEGVDDVAQLEKMRLAKNEAHVKSIKENADLIGGTGPRSHKSITPGYEFTETGGLLKPAEVDLSQHIGDEIIPMPYDATSRGIQLNKVNDLDLDILTHGGDEHMDAVENIEAKIAGASSKSIVDKIVKRIKAAGLRSERRGGTGQVLIATNTMGDMSEGFAKAPAMTAIQVVSQGNVGARKKFNTEFRNMSSSKAGLTDGKTGKKKYGPTPFKNLPDVTSKEFEDIMLGKTEYKVKVDGVEKVMTPSHIRKALWKEMALVKNQTAFHYAWDDLQKAQLRASDIEKGFMGNRIAVVKDPKTIKAIENKDVLTKEIYDSAFNGERLGTLDIGAQPIEKLMPERYKQAYERWKKRYPTSSPSNLRNMAIGQLEKATKDAEVFSETITPGLIDSIYKKK